MCEADTGILTYVWVKGHPAPFPDFNVSVHLAHFNSIELLANEDGSQHKCRNIENILDWVSEHQLHMKEGHRVERQPGAQELESPP
jgi:hypothetical protein